MEQIIITRKDGTTYPLAVKREVTSIKEARQICGLLGDDVVNISVESPYPQHYEIGDYFNVFGRTYKLNQLPRVRKLGMHKFAYDLTFEGVQYDLLRAFYDVTIETTGNTLQDVQGDALAGNLKRFASVLISNANRVFPGMWNLGACPDTPADKTLTFAQGDNCLAVFHTLCKTFDVEASISELNGIRTIDFFNRIGTTHPFVFEFGKGKGLYALERRNADSSNIVTRLKVFGSADNITNKYRANRLCLPGRSKGQSFIERSDAVRRYGIHEACKIFEDIKPTFNGVVAATVPGNVLQFKDENMFDLNATEADGITTKYRVNGISPKIHFNTGNLAGYEFDIHRYDHSTRTFTLKKLTAEKGYVFPSDTSPSFQFAKGDTYKILDVALPERYQAEAEEKLQEQANEYYRQNSRPKVKYGLRVSKSYLQRLFGEDVKGSLFSPGDYIRVKDEGIGIDDAVRIQSFERNLSDIYDYTLTLSDVAQHNIATRVISDLIEIDKITTMHKLKDPTRARANWLSSREVLDMVFDPDGDYYTEKIKPNSIDTLSLAVGAKSMQFALQDVVFEPNYHGQRNTLRVSTGTLTHYTVEENPRTWVIPEVTIEMREDTTPYYIFARCSKASDTAAIVLSKTPIKADQDGDAYHFWIGVVNSVDPALKARSIALSYGFSMVNGRFIKTGRIESADGTTYFDLDDGEIGGNIKFSGGKYRGQDLALWAEKTESAQAATDRKAVAADSKAAAADSKAVEAGSKATEADKKAEEAKALIDGLRVGLRNIVKNGGTPKREKGRYCLYELYTPMEANEVYTVSFDADIHTDKGVLQAGAYARNKKNESIFCGSLAYIKTAPLKPGGRRYVGTLKPTRDAPYLYLYPQKKYTSSDSPEAGEVVFTNVAIYKGRGVEEFIPAPEDWEASLRAAREEAEKAQKRAEDTYTKAQADGLVTATEQKAIDVATEQARLAKAYADAQDRLLEGTLKRWADGEITTLETLTKRELEARVALAKAEWEAYADGRVSAEERARIEALRAALAKAEQALTAAQTADKKAAAADSKAAAADSKAVAADKKAAAADSKAVAADKKAAAADSKAAAADSKAVAADSKATEADKKAAAADKKAEAVRAAQERMDYLTRVFTQGQTEIRGGAVLSEALLLKDERGVLTGYLNGHPDEGGKGAGGLVLGGEHLFTPEEKRRVYLSPQGLGHIGRLVIYPDGHLGICEAPEDPQAVPSVRFGGSLRPLSDLVGASAKREGRGRTFSFESTTLGQERRSSAPLEISYPQAVVTVKGSIYISWISPEGVHSDVIRRGSVMLSLKDSGGNIIYTLCRKEFTNNPLITGLPPGETGELLIPIDFSAVIAQAGTYTVSADWNITAGTAAGEMPKEVVFRLSGGTTEFRWEYTPDVKEIVFSDDGVSAFFDRRRMLYVPRDPAVPLTIKGSTDMPGVLCAGRVDKWGNARSVWGAKFSRGSDTTVRKIGTGVYQVSHSIGHENYYVTANIYTDGGDPKVHHANTGDYKRDSFIIRTVNHHGHYSDMSFTFMAVGDNI